MRGRYLHTTAIVFLACIIILAMPVSAVQSTEQSLSDSLTRGGRFTITITGLPNTPYYIWLPGTSTMSGEPYDRPPVISDTASVVKDPEGGPYTIGSYQYNNGDGRTIRDDVAPSTSNMSNTNYYAQATTDEKGQVIVEFQATAYTGLRSYSVKVENPNAPESENFQVEQKVYSRTARPMVNTPVTTVAPLTYTPTFTPLPPSIPTTSPETLPATTVPTTPTPIPTKKSPVTGEIAALAFAGGTCLAALGKRRII